MREYKSIWISFKCFHSIILILTLFLVITACRKNYSSDYSVSKVINDRSHYPEGPLIYEKNIYYVEYSKDRIMKWDGKKNIQFWEKKGCGPASILSQSELIVVACYDSNSLEFINLKGQSISVIDKDFSGGGFTGPNDFAADEKGGIYFTASGVFETSAPVEGAVYYISADKKVEKKADNLHYPNGLAVINKGTSLLVNEHFGPQITSFAIDSKGNLNKKQIFLSLKGDIPRHEKTDGYTGPDGIEVTDDKIFICHYGASQILVTDYYGVLQQIIPVPLKYVTNIDITEDKEFLYVTAVENSSTAPYEGKVFQYKKK